MFHAPRAGAWTVTEVRFGDADNRHNRLHLTHSRGIAATPSTGVTNSPLSDSAPFRSNDSPVLFRTAAATSLVLLMAISGTAGASRPNPAPIKVRITLDSDRVAAGQRIKGTVLLTNTTHQTITVNTCADNGWLQVGLKGHGYAYQATSWLILCPPSIRLVPGANRFSVTVLTSYETCSQPDGKSLTPTPKCISNHGHPPFGNPPLPSGKYSTTVSIFGLPHLTRPPNHVKVTLLRRAS